jgi:hypothetical protein
MTFFNPSEPILRRKQHALDYQDRQGLLQIKIQVKNNTLFSTLYTRIDQVFILWGVITATIFITAQFSPISWTTQAIVWSVLTLFGTIFTIGLTYFWVTVERLRWLLYTWSMLMVIGVAITDASIFLGWGQVLLYLSHLWLGLFTVGYFCTAMGLRSRAFFLSAIVHLLGIASLSYFEGWQFLTTGLVAIVNLFVFAQIQWDMRLPIKNYKLLTEKQKQFNSRQQQLRQATG